MKEFRKKLILESWGGLGSMAAVLLGMQELTWSWRIRLVALGPNWIQWVDFWKN